MHDNVFETKDNNIETIRVKLNLRNLNLFIGGFNWKSILNQN